MNDLLADRDGDGVPDLIAAALGGIPAGSTVTHTSTQVVNTQHQVLVQVTHADGRVETRREVTTHTNGSMPSAVDFADALGNLRPNEVVAQPKARSSGLVIAVVLITIFVGAVGIVVAMVLL